MKLDSPVETIVGAVVLLVAITFAVFAAQSGGVARVAGESYPVVAQFSSAGGVAPGTDVRIAGVKIGSVSEVQLDPDSFRAVATLAIRRDIALDDGTVAKIDSEGLLGGNFIALEPGAGLNTLEPGDEIEITQGSVSFLDILGRALSAMADGSDK